jgi:hypothetical protein
MAKSDGSCWPWDLHTLALLTGRTFIARIERRRCLRELLHAAPGQRS